MATKKNYVDFREAYKVIGKTEKQLRKNQMEALKYAGDYASRYLKVKTPVDRETRVNMKDHVVYSTPTQNKPYTEVGFDKEVAWRVHFVEFGTIKQRPQPFIQTTMEDIEDKVASIIQSYMSRGLNK